MRLRLPIVLLAAAACTGAPPASPASAGDCVALRLWSNGYHTNIALPAALFPGDHPIRALFPDANYLLIGWGERDFYMDPDPDFRDGVAALLGPRPSVIQVIAHEQRVEDTIWRPRDLVEFSVSRSGAGRLIESIGESLTLDARGAAQVLSEGRVSGDSVFLAARPAFHVFHMCNHWTAARLRDAGVSVRPLLSFSAPALMDAVRTKAPACADID